MHSVVTALLITIVILRRADVLRYGPVDLMRGSDVTQNALGKGPRRTNLLCESLMWQHAMHHTSHCARASTRSMRHIACNVPAATVRLETTIGCAPPRLRTTPPRTTQERALQGLPLPRVWRARPLRLRPPAQLRGRGHGPAAVALGHVDTCVRCFTVSLLFVGCFCCSCTED